ncbi:hypothetical protein VIBNISO65_970033 [Vibrio nigripulchritudo SO65]|uniref:hypothetical protein n=1 Tax=Vibrio nigripulchritudo TaxID=28173 RepID=UPI0003B208DB|nr:hypothetical protein [Vibrio nigripulchritudo]CCN42951.1 hypothetical protein VIBNIFTn2_420088 [Vibrio nigripulchritudo FTn2]CCN65407.1 hypothetical protein VIBNIPon4_390033 [Vibrio nigripulchritudo POn4]CCN79472.1 hypothetical protein VIBNISO65_970033 [Vibrio nigripulchritudo SO65]
MIKQYKLVDVLDALSAEYRVSFEDMADTLVSMGESWIDIEDCPKYQQHKDSGIIRNRSTHRVLKPNNSGYVKVRNLRGEIVARKQGVGS